MDNNDNNVITMILETMIEGSCKILQVGYDCAEVCL